MLRIRKEGEATVRASLAIWSGWLASWSGQARAAISTDGEDGGTEPRLIPRSDRPRIPPDPAPGPGDCPASRPEAPLQAKGKPVKVFR